MIPRELQEQAEWCVWRRETRKGKPTKVPYDPVTGRRAETDKPETFRTYEEADEAMRIESEYNGLGIRVSNGYSAVDIDHCVSDGRLSDLAREICDYMNSYTELSPSKTGLRIIIKGDISYDKSKYYLKNPNNGVELYVSGMTNRFMTITGNTLMDLPVRQMTGEDLTNFLEKHMRRRNGKVTDDQVIEKASRNDKFRALFNGEISAYQNDHSSADLALCNFLAFWTNKDAAQMDRVFRRSGLFREKWEREDYRNNTIQSAIEHCTDTYDPAKFKKIWERLNAPEYDTGEWTVDDTGVHRETMVRKQQATVYATSTPIVPVTYLENHENGSQKVELHYLCGRDCRTILCDKETIASKTKILSLANYGINVNSNNATQLIQYLSDIETLNHGRIKRVPSISHLGWVGKKFVPYDSDIRFDADAENRSMFQAVAQVGDYDRWVETMRPLRKNLYLRLIMAASFASPLIERVQTLPFVFHLWGETGKGKTVALMVAMSIWGNPAAGKLTRTMNTTNAAMISTAAFLNNLPFAGDELQTIKDERTTYDKLIMQITEGIERGRMQYNKNLPTRSWNCAFLFTGEERCTTEKSGGGAQNRVFEVEFDGSIVENGNRVVRFISRNHGHAGRKFIEYIAEKDLADRYDDIKEEILDSFKTTEKQAATAALILLADRLAGECIFPGEEALNVSDIAGFIKTIDEVSVPKRAYDYIVGWIAKNDVRFMGGAYGESWGIKDMDSIFIIDSVLAEALENVGFTFDAVKKTWVENGWLIPYRSSQSIKYKKRKAINGAKPYCAEIVLPSLDEVDQ